MRKLYKRIEIDDYDYVLHRILPRRIRSRGIKQAKDRLREKGYCVRVLKGKIPSGRIRKAIYKRRC